MPKRKRVEIDRDRLLRPEELLSTLVQVAPFSASSLQAYVTGSTDEADLTLHEIMQSFRSCFKQEIATEDEVKSIARLIDVSLIKRDDLENAVMTCFIEHDGLSLRLKSLLAPQTRAYIKRN